MVIFTSNALSVRFFAETEFWFSFIKVAAIVLFILIGGCAVFGVLPIQGYDHAPLFENFVKDGLFPNGWMPVFTTMLTVNFAFSGTELIGVTAGETKDPDKAFPKAIHTTLFRLVIFFTGSIMVMASLIPWQDAGVDESPLRAGVQLHWSAFRRRRDELRCAHRDSFGCELRVVRLHTHAVVLGERRHDPTQHRQNQ